MADTQDALSKRQIYDQVREKLYADRSNFEGHWRDLGNYFLPRRTRFWIDDPNQDRRSNKIIDNTGLLAARTLASGFHAGISSPARPWFRLTVPDPDLAEYGPVKQFLHTVTQRMLTVFALSNLYNGLPVLYKDLGVFGSPAMSMLEDSKEVLRVYPHPIGSFALGLDRRQQVKTCIREYTMTVRQLVDEFVRNPDDPAQFDWEVCSTAVKNLWNRHQYESRVHIVWMVLPNSDYDPSKLEAKYLPYAGVWFERDATSAKLLKESGYHEFPVLAPRWDVTGEDTYATDCPGIEALNDSKALQVMQRKKAQAVEIGINPSLQAPTSLKNQKISLLPADVTFVDMLQQQNAAIRPIREVHLEALKWFTNDIQETQYRVKRAFFEDLFLMIAQQEGPQMTAREVAERHEEKLLALGPVLERMNDELFDPLVDRTFGLMGRAGLVPEPPDELVGQPLKVEYISLIAGAQKLVGAVSLDRFITSTMAMMQAFPEVRHKINAMEVVDEYSDMLAINPKIVVPDEEAQKALEAEQQAIARQRQTEQLEQASKAAKNLAGSDMAGDTALKRLMEVPA